MKAIIIRSTGASYIDLPGNDDPARLPAMQRAIGCSVLAAGGYPDNQHAAYVDDEGLLTLQDGDSMIMPAWHPEWMAGNILITGFDPATGDDTPCTLTIAEVARMILRRGFYLPRNAG